MDEIERTRLFFKWVLASVVAWVVAGALFEATEWAVPWAEPWAEPWVEVMPLVAAGVGAIIGAIQWLMLREQVSRAGWWVLASTLGWAVAGGVWTGAVWAVSWAQVLVWVLALGGAAAGAVVGALSGTIQWLVLRKQISDAGWWVLASTLGWAAAAAVALVTLWAMPWIRVMFGGLALAGGVGGVAFGVITGTALVWLLE